MRRHSADTCSPSSGDRRTRRISSTCQEDGRKTFGHNTLESLPHADHYRNIIGPDGKLKQRPTLIELHEQRFQVRWNKICRRDNISGETGKLFSAEESKPLSRSSTKFGWIKGVLVRCVLNIFGVMLFLRLSWVVGQAGIGLASVIVLLASTVTTLTALSMSAICTNGEVRGGGAYYMISRSLGPEFGGAIGIIFSIANAVAAAMYIVGFAETVVVILKNNNCLMVDMVNDVRIIGVITAFLILTIALAGLSWEARAQLILLVILMIAILDCMIGTFIPPSEEDKEKGFVGYNVQTFVDNFTPDFRDGHSFFSVFGIFFPAATGILAGANISGDLKAPIPKGTLLAILITTIVYLMLCWMVGATNVRDALGPLANASSGLDFNESLTTFLMTTTLNICGLHTLVSVLNCLPVMQLISMFGPITIAGIVSATLSSALASLVSAPRVFQAVCKDQIFPYIHFFGKGYGKNDDPRRSYGLAFVIGIACICIGELNAIAPLISNFFLMSYALINYSCVDASLAKSPGWRPAFKFYSMWLSLLGALLCVAVMFIINWSTALITIVLVAILYFYVHYRKPDINWGSSGQAHAYRNALQHTQKLMQVLEHVKNFRPQVLALTSFPSERPALVDFCTSMTKNISLMVCGHVIIGDPSQKLKDAQLLTKLAHMYLTRKRSKSFYTAICAPSLRLGVQSLLQSVGVGKLRPNTLIMGFKSDWLTSDVKEVEDFCNIIHDAFDLKHSVGVLRLAEGLQLKTVPQQPSQKQQKQRHRKGKTSTTRHQQQHQLQLLQLLQQLQPPVTTEPCSSSQLRADRNLIKKVTETAGLSRFSHKQKGFIDVWWLFDDGGMTLLMPHLMTTKKLWSHCKLRIYMAGTKKEALDHDQRHLASLLHKFRIKYSSMHVVMDIGKRPSAGKMEMFMDMLNDWRLKEGETTEEFPWKITDSELSTFRNKTYRQLRLRELLEEHSHDATFIAMTLPMPKKGLCSTGLYMAWLDVLSRSMPPMLLIRGNQENVLTFYS
ncbi:hypothetical protein HELRODRAFT_74876 [Helobdella robusta]|uniref:SLC12A transporter C-terminal domain-containing protein n=1 Tax=Helobdella robusta TaxID=6412 RepID=T1G1X0_HELRO|nr:hypothetical protein HELRODRAFT_74876 [Helobdella robusta]ESO08644.1 hypothetical protein HELRODRAFT_74876 [Helobdella robusta]